MGNEFQVTKDIATISATLSELVSINRIIYEEIQSPDFTKEYNSLIHDIQDSYQIVVQTLHPLAEINSVKDFKQQFDKVFDDFGAQYQATHSTTRVNAEYTFEKYLQFRKRKEVKTSYPILKKTFSRLHDFIDKWIDDDIWLSLTIDTMLKMLFRHLNEVAELKSKDLESAFGLYESCAGSLSPYLEIMDAFLQKLNAR